MSQSRTRIVSALVVLAAVACSLAMPATAFAAYGDSIEHAFPLTGDPATVPPIPSYMGSSMTTDLISGSIAPTGHYYFRVLLSMGETFKAGFTPGAGVLNLKVLVLPYAAGYPIVESSTDASGVARLTYVAPTTGMYNLYAGASSLGTITVEPTTTPPVPTSITIRTTATSVRTGAIPILSGAVTPLGMIGRNIVVWVKKPGKAYFSYSSNRTVYNLGGNAVWQYKYYFKPGMVKGYYVFKASAPAPGFASSLGFLTSNSPTTVTIRLR